MDILLPQALLFSWLHVAARLLGWAWIDPLLSRLPWSLRLFVAGTLAWVWVPHSTLSANDPLSIPGVLQPVLSFILGASIGFVARLLVAAAQAALSYVGLVANLGLSQSQPDSRDGLDSVLSRLGWWLALLAFFSANGHLLVLQALHASFAILPVDALLAAGATLDIADMGRGVFYSAVRLALPVLVLVLLAQLSIAMLSRMLPGVDGFSLGMTLAVFALLAGLAMAIPLMSAVLVHGFSGMTVWLPQFPA